MDPQHAAVTVTWTSDAERTIGALTDEHGYWRVCGVPREAALSVQVVADSGSDELTGIGGSFTVNIVDGKHFYQFEYSLPAEPA